MNPVNLEKKIENSINQAEKLQDYLKECKFKIILYREYYKNMSFM